MGAISDMNLLTCPPILAICICLWKVYEPSPNLPWLFPPLPSIAAKLDPIDADFGRDCDPLILPWPWEESSLNTFPVFMATANLSVNWDSPDEHAG